MVVVEGSGFVPRSWLASFQDMTLVLPPRELCTPRLALVADMPAVALGSTQVRSPAPSTSGSVVALGAQGLGQPSDPRSIFGAAGGKEREFSTKDSWVGANRLRPG